MLGWWGAACREPGLALSQDSGSPDSETRVCQLPLLSARDSGNAQPCLQRLSRQTGDSDSMENKRQPPGTNPHHCAVTHEQYLGVMEFISSNCSRLPASSCPLWPSPPPFPASSAPSGSPHLTPHPLHLFSVSPATSPLPPLTSPSPASSHLYRPPFLFPLTEFISMVSMAPKILMVPGSLSPARLSPELQSQKVTWSLHSCPKTL